MRQLLVIDDEQPILTAFQRAFSDENTTVLTATTATEGEQMFENHKPDVVIVDLRLPDKTGLECFRSIHALDSHVPVIFITGHGTVDTAIEATKLGAYDYLFKPLELDEIRSLLEKAFNLSRMIRVQPVFSQSENLDEIQDDSIVGRCHAMTEVYKSIGRIAPQNITVLLQGESGTGKEVIAQAIYHHSSRPEKPFYAINCAAIPDALLESEIFGHEKGAFTDANRQRIGKLEQADQGTLFLDEVGDMSPMTQAKLLRVLQDRSFERVGSNQSIQVDVRIIAATNHDLKKRVADGSFRSDLFFRLNDVTIELPPLRDRGDDIRLLAEYFLRKYRREFGKELRTFSDQTIAVLQKYKWPGNVRELESVIKQSLLSATGSVLLPEFLPALLTDESEIKSDDEKHSSKGILTAEFIADRLSAGTSALYAESIALAEAQLLRQVLEHTKGNQLQAAELLGISRVTLRSKLRALGIAASHFSK